MALSWNEIKDRALHFSKEWEGTTNEDADAKPFLVEFFNIFGVSSKRVSSFEYRVKRLDSSDGYIDLLWKGVILIEMKSWKKSLEKAYNQAIDYFPGLKEHELPKYILVCDFETFRLYNLEDNSIVEFKLNELVNNVQHFGFISGYQKKVYKEQDPANIKAAELMGKLHDRLEEIGYSGHPLEVYLVRILFCLFADDTNIFQKQQFQDFIEQRTNEDGSDLASKLQELFQVLNTHEEKRFKNIDEQLAAFPYVNGKLFEENLPVASFDSKMRQALLNCCYIDWSNISPAIFGSMFQSVMNPKERRNLGAHYTSETNILKLIKPLFLDELWEEFESLKNNKSRLIDFHLKLSRLTFLDPACGCGNFLVITYRELRLLELEVLRSLNKSGQMETDINHLVWLDVDMMHGIEYEEFPARIAEVAMWLIDHQMNMLVSAEFGHYLIRLPLKKAAKIVHGNALQIDWNDLLSKKSVNITSDNTVVTLKEPYFEYTSVNIKTRNLTIIDNRHPEPDNVNIRSKYDYILGNPPFVGKSNQSPEQKRDMDKLFGGFKGAGVLDYVTAWYVKAAQLIQNTNTKAAFVSTNSITQGEQVGVLWNILFNYFKIKIHFAHRTFKWRNEAKGNAAVYVVIIGFANFDIPEKKIYDYESVKDEPQERFVKNINPYLIEGKEVLLLSRSTSLCRVNNLVAGNKPVDGGFLLFSDDEKNEFIIKEPQSAKYFKHLISAKEYLNKENRWCLWLQDCPPDELKNMPMTIQRIKSVKEFRNESNKRATREAAAFPSLFVERRLSKSNFVFIPLTSSENRKYIPLDFFTKDFIINNSASMLPEATLFEFGVLSSIMHMIWVKSVCGRLEGRFRYSNEIVYNNYPWPENPTDKQVKAIEEKAQKVLDVRKEFPNSSLADLYDPLTMPPALVKAHNELDKAVDLAYRPQPFTSEANRMVYLFELYEKYTANLFTEEKPKRRKKKAE